MSEHQFTSETPSSLSTRTQGNGPIAAADPGIHVHLRALLTSPQRERHTFLKPNTQTKRGPTVPVVKDGESENAKLSPRTY